MQQPSHVQYTRLQLSVVALLVHGEVVYISSRRFGRRLAAASKALMMQPCVHASLCLSLRSVKLTGVIRLNDERDHLTLNVIHR